VIGQFLTVKAYYIYRISGLSRNHIDQSQSSVLKCKSQFWLWLVDLLKALRLRRKIFTCKGLYER